MAALDRLGLLDGDPQGGDWCGDFRGACVALCRYWLARTKAGEFRLIRYCGGYLRQVDAWLPGGLHEALRGWNAGEALWFLVASAEPEGKLVKALRGW